MPQLTTYRRGSAKPKKRWNGPLSEEARKRANCRSYTKGYIRRGKLVPGPCVRCGQTVDIQAHHEDYSKPLDVTWLCRSCHMDLHRERQEGQR